MSQQSATVDKRPSHQRASRMNERQGAGHTPPGRPAGETAGIAEPSVSVRELDIAFGAHKVISGLDLDVSPGEFIVLLGPSGCGKSTLLNAIAGLLDISDGEIWIDGKNVTWAEPKDRGIGMVFQSYALYPRMSVEKNLSFGLRISKLPKAEIDGRVARVAELLQLDGLLKRRPSELSGGQRQRVAIGRALVRNVDVFLFDEPLSNLDAKLRQHMRVQIKHIQRELKITTVYVTHDQIEAMTLADRIVIMDKGAIQQIGTPDEIYNDPANTFVASFIGSPPMNLIEGTLANGTFTAPGVKVEGLPLEHDGKITLGARPEDCSVLEGSGHVEGSVYGVEPTGDITYLTIKGGDKLVEVKADRDYRAELNSTAHVGFDPARIYLFDTPTGERIR